MDRTRKKRKQLKAFTLLELMIVIAIISALMAIVVPSLTSQARDAKQKASNEQAEALYRATQEFLNDLHIRNERASNYFGTEGVLICKAGYERGSFSSANLIAGQNTASTTKRIWDNEEDEWTNMTVDYKAIAAEEIYKYLSEDFNGAWYVSVYPNTYTVRVAIYSGQIADEGDSSDIGKYDWSSVENRLKNPFKTMYGGGKSETDQEYVNNRAGDPAFKYYLEDYVGQYPISADVAAGTIPSGT